MPCLRIFSLTYWKHGMELNFDYLAPLMIHPLVKHRKIDNCIYIINKNILQELLSTNEIEVKTKCQECLSIFDPKTILGNWKACIKPRPYNKRALLWLCISIFLMQMFIFVS